MVIIRIILIKMIKKIKIYSKNVNRKDGYNIYERREESYKTGIW